MLTDRMLTEDLIQSLPLDAFLKPETRRQRLQLLLRLAAKQLRKLRLETLRHERLQHLALDVFARVPRAGVHFLRRGAHLVDPAHQRVHDAVDFRGGVLAPGVELAVFLRVEEGLGQRAPGGGGGGVQHALQADVLPQPDRPRDAGAGVDLQLGAEQVVALVVGGGGVGVPARVGVDGAELAVPDGRVVGELEFGFTLVLALQAGELGRGAGEGVAGGEAHGGVVVEGVDGVWEHVGEAFPFAGEGVAVQPEDVVRVDLADRGFDAVVEGGEADV